LSAILQQIISYGQFRQHLKALIQSLEIAVHDFCDICATHTWYTDLFNGPFSGTTQVSQYQKGKTNLDFTEARDSEWQWHQLGNMQVCTLLQSPDRQPHQHPTTLFLQAGCSSCRPTNSVKALKAIKALTAHTHTWY